MPSLASPITLRSGATAAELEQVHADFLAAALRCSAGRATILDPDWPRHILADPAFAPERGPLTRQQFHAIAVGDRFVDYLHRFRLVRGE